MHLFIHFCCQNTHFCTFWFFAGFSRCRFLVFREFFAALPSVSLFRRFVLAINLCSVLFFALCWWSFNFLGLILWCHFFFAIFDLRLTYLSVLFPPIFAYFSIVFRSARAPAPQCTHKNPFAPSHTHTKPYPTYTQKHDVRGNFPGHRAQIRAC